MGRTKKDWAGCIPSETSSSAEVNFMCKYYIYIYINK